MKHTRFPVSKMRHCIAPMTGVLLALGLAMSVHAQLVNYTEHIGAYKDMQASGIRLQDTVSPGIEAKARVNKALREGRVTDYQALQQADGTLKLPTNQQNLVIRTNYSDINNQGNRVNIASPTITGNVNGVVTLFVDGKAPDNITVLNNRQ